VDSEAGYENLGLAGDGQSGSSLVQTIASSLFSFFSDRKISPAPQRGF
jgi:hypothetical protein